MDSWTCKSFGKSRTWSRTGLGTPNTAWMKPTSIHSSKPKTLRRQTCICNKESIFERLYRAVERITEKMQVSLFIYT